MTLDRYLVGRRAARPPLVLPVGGADARRHMDESIDGLRRRTPDLSAGTTVSPGQKRGLIVLGVLVLVGFIVAPARTGTALAAFVTCLYAAAVLYRLLCFKRGIAANTLITVSDEDALAWADEDLPRYTVLVPAYREPEVVPRLLSSLERLDYPRDRLEVLLLLEADDVETLAAVRRQAPEPHVRVVVVPDWGPRTKPKACNYGLQLATGELVTIYDAEDRPEPLQLRRAAVAFARGGDRVACLQAQLAYYNADQNRLTKWFTGEYVTWFLHFLPGLVALQAPVPLGGTSNHMRVDLLRALGAWDPFNVTEDADLGIRLHRAGFTTGVLDSVTYEEANSDAVNWLKQRSRWYKGYLQTFLVHSRNPLALRREIGWRGVLGFGLFVGGTPVLSALNPLFWSMSVLWLVAQPAWLGAIFPAPWYYLALFSWVGGNAAIIYLTVLSMREAGRDELVPSALLTPFYWVLMSVAAAKAFGQLVSAPSFWEKTQHGLDTQTASAQAAA